jgi:hypothetical protein
MGRESNIDIQIRALEQQVKSLHHVTAVQKRKERTRRLIQKGALLEKYFGLEHLDVNETEEILRMVSSFVREKIPEKFKHVETD